MTRWVTINDPAWADLPCVSACYCLFYASGKIAYVGQTSNLRKRIWTHIRPLRYSDNIFSEWGVNLNLKYRQPKCVGEHAMAEIRLIGRLQPPLNRAGRNKKGIA